MNITPEQFSHAVHWASIIYLALMALTAILTLSIPKTRNLVKNAYINVCGDAYDFKQKALVTLILFVLLLVYPISIYALSQEEK